MVETMGCKYCQTDSDGFSLLLPRFGQGNAIIRKVPFDGWCIDVSGPQWKSMKIPISFCPFCGAKLSGGDNHG